MKTDRELLEAAAKAAGYPPPLSMHGLGGLNFGFGWWNPLVNPGEAFELAIQLNMEVRPCQARPYGQEVRWSFVPSKAKPDDVLSTCRAIVLAAAAMAERGAVGAA